jgi:hypothetical protein
MKKLELNVGALRVESFTVAPAVARAGTVGAAAVTVGTCIGPTYCCRATWKNTCMSCEGTCDESCWGTCEITCDLGACPL